MSMHGERSGTVCVLYCDASLLDTVKVYWKTAQRRMDEVPSLHSFFS
jgi:hypothetical protein